MQVDLIDFSGPAFPNVDNRVAALRLVQKELCDAALFDPSGNFSSSFCWMLSRKLWVIPRDTYMRWLICS